MFRHPYQFNGTKIRLGATLMALSLQDNGNKFFEIHYEGENNYDDAEDGDVYSEPNDEKWKAFFVRS